MGQLIRVHQSIFEVGAYMLVNPVNCVGVMGAGLAKEFKRRSSSYFLDYKGACERGEVTTEGGLHVYWMGYKVLVSFPTKRHWKDPSSIEHIRLGLLALTRYVYLYPNATSVAMPYLGCGLGGLDPEPVEALINEWTRLALPSEHRVFLCKP